MSDTPKTDAVCGWPVGHHGRIDSSDLTLSPDGPFVHSSVAREVERENAALKQRILDDNKAYGCELMDPSGTIWDHAKRLQQENAALRKAKDILELERCEMMRTMSLLCNQAEQLQEDKERLDWLDQKIVSSWLDGKDFVIWDKFSPQPCSIREWLDAARKEAQP